MATPVLIIGESGTGKSTSIRNLNPEETYIMKIIDKPLPFKPRIKYKEGYIDQEGNKINGNLFVSDDYSKLKRCLLHVANERLEIKNIVIDDFQYLMANEFMRRASETGFKKFVDIAVHAHELIKPNENLRSNLNIFFLCHSDVREDGKVNIKTIGKFLDEKIDIAGLFTIVLHSIVSNGKYKFLTQNDGTHIAKSPMEMFEENYIDNDLEYVKNKIEKYYME